MLPPARTWIEPACKRELHSNRSYFKERDLGEDMAHPVVVFLMSRSPSELDTWPARWQGHRVG